MLPVSDMYSQDRVAMVNTAIAANKEMQKGQKRRANESPWWDFWVRKSQNKEDPGQDSVLHVMHVMIAMLQIGTLQCALCPRQMGADQTGHANL